MFRFHASTFARVELERHDPPPRMRAAAASQIVE